MWNTNIMSQRLALLVVMVLGVSSGRMRQEIHSASVAVQKTRTELTTFLPEICVVFQKGLVVG